MKSTASFTIMVIDDESGFRRTYSDLFKYFGHTVMEASDGEAGWKLIKSKKPDIVLLDLVMPKLSGYDLLQRLKSDRSTKHIPVIVFSVLSEQNDIQKALKSGANDYIVKGLYSANEVVSKVGNFLARPEEVK